MNADRLMALLPTGEENAISGEELQRLLGLQDSRSLRKFIHAVRSNSDELILSSGSGFFKPRRFDEICAFVRRMERMGSETFKAASSARRYMRAHADELTGQLSFDFGAE